MSNFRFTDSEVTAMSEQMGVGGGTPRTAKITNTLEVSLTRTGYSGGAFNPVSLISGYTHAELAYTVDDPHGILDVDFGVDGEFGLAASGLWTIEAEIGYSLGNNPTRTVDLEIYQYNWNSTTPLSDRVSRSSGFGYGVSTRLYTSNAGEAAEGPRKIGFQASTTEPTGHFGVTAGRFDMYCTIWS